MSQVFISGYKRFSLVSLAFVVVFVFRFSNETLNFRVMAVRDIELRKHILISYRFLAHSEVEVLGLLNTFYPEIHEVDLRQV